MGPEEFRIGVKRFLEKYKYGNAVTADLWHELTGVSSSELNITRIMDTWTRQMGYPVLTVSTKAGSKYSRQLRKSIQKTVQLKHFSALLIL